MFNMKAIGIRGARFSTSPCCEASVILILDEVTANYKHAVRAMGVKNRRKFACVVSRITGLS